MIMNGQLSNYTLIFYTPLFLGQNTTLDERMITNHIFHHKLK